MSTPYSLGKEVISWGLVSMFYSFMLLLSLELQNNMYKLFKTKTKIAQMVPIMMTFAKVQTSPLERTMLMCHFNI
jgi:hypothetical protein